MKRLPKKIKLFGIPYRVIPPRPIEAIFTTLIHEIE